MTMKVHRLLPGYLACRQTLLGLLQMRLNPLLVEMASEYGYDFIVLDAEHGTFSENDFAESLKAIAATDALALVRLASHDTQALRRYLQMGADAIVAPHVSTVEQARALVAAMGSQETASLIVLLESALAVTNAEAILAVDGVAAAFVGPNDLTEDLGCKGDYTSPVYAQALAFIERAAAATGKPLGSVPHGNYSLEVLAARGHRIFLLGTDRSLLSEAMSAQVANAKSVLKLAAVR